MKLIEKAGFKSPSPVQMQAIPITLRGDDLIVSSQTGSGKTATFVLPMADKICGREGTLGLILAPTREIAQQIQQTLETFGTPRGIRSCVLIGGIDMRLDDKALATYPQVIVATPGRLCDHLDRGNIWLDYVEFVVLDEADRMLDMGFTAQLSRIMEEVPENRQTLLFSATIPPSVDRLAQKILYKPARVTIGKPLGANAAVEQVLIHVSEDNKPRELLRLIRNEPGSIIIFMRSKEAVTRIWNSLHSAGIYDATYISSDRQQQHREQALAEFKSGKYRILIATDVAGRGIHVEGVAHVVNYDLPMEAENYVHRIGRTGRAGATGRATSYCTPRDRRLLGDIEKILGKPIPTVGGGPETIESDRSGGRDSGRGGRGGDRDRGSRGGQGGGGRGGESRGRSAETRAPQVSDGPRPVKPVQQQKAAPKPEGSEAPKNPESTGVAGSEGGDPAKRKRRRGGRGRRGGGGSGGDAPGGGSPSGGAPSGGGSRSSFPV